MSTSLVDLANSSFALIALIFKARACSAQQLTGDESLHLPHCPSCHISSVWHFINTTAYHLGGYEPSSPSTKELHGKEIY